MIFGKLLEVRTHPVFGHDNIWRDAFSALASLTRRSPLGVTPLRGDSMFINVHTYKTKMLEDCRFEGHRNMVDVQFVIEGGEYIDWVDKSELVEDGEYLVGNDFQYYKNPLSTPGTRLHLQAGHVGVFFPQDGHRPQINDGMSPGVLKAVVKIHRKLLD